MEALLKGKRRGWLGLLLVALLQAGCVSPGWLPAQETSGASPRQSAAPLLTPPAHWRAEGRFAVKAGNQSAAGRFAWTRAGGGTQTVETLLLMDPLGGGLAELTVDAQGARLQTAQGRRESAASLAGLMVRLLNLHLPESSDGAWLLGLPGPDARERDGRGRPLRRQAAGWVLDFDYADGNSPDPLAPGARPERVMGSGPAGEDLRLRIESWE